MRKKAFGIDLGTTNSVLSLMKEGTPTIIPIGANDEQVLRSAVYFSEIGGQTRVTTGSEAVNRSLSNSAKTKNFMHDFKRDIGSNIVTEAPDHTRLNSIVLSGLILHEFKKRSLVVSEELGLEEPIQEAVITVPAYFDSTQRSATKIAGMLAGFNVLRIINEPTAAAIAYANKHNISGNVLLYDLGGGTFDVTIMHVDQNRYNILATKGDHRLGGLKFDEAIRDFIIEKLEEQGVNKTMMTPEKRMRLLLEAEKIKIQLSINDEAFYEDEDGEHGVIITRSDFEARTRILVQSTEFILNDTLLASGLKWTDIDYVLLVGGSTRLPIIRQRIEEITGITPHYDLNPDTIVAEGASIIADLLVNQEVTFKEMIEGEETEQPLVVINDITSQGIGVLFKKKPQEYYNFGGDYYNKIIMEPNTPIPSKASIPVYASGENQRAFKLRLTEGNDANPMFVKETILNAVIPISTPRRRGELLANVTVEYDEEQIIHVTVYDPDTNEVLKTFEVQGSVDQIETDLELDIEDLDYAIKRFIR